MAGVHELMVGCNEVSSSSSLGPGHIKLCFKKRKKKKALFPMVRKN